MNSMNNKWNKIVNIGMVVITTDFLITAIFKRELNKQSFYIYWQIISVLIGLFFLVALYFYYKTKKND